jgi:hypothetical protein
MSTSISFSFSNRSEAAAYASSLTDQQNERSSSYQQGKQNTDDERNNPMPTIRALVRSGAFLRRSDTQPEEKFVHRVSAIIGAALC